MNDGDDDPHRSRTDPGGDAEPQNLRERLVRESGVTGWPDLARHFARGSLVRVSTTIDLVDVAMAVAEDDTDTVGRWLVAGDLERAGDGHAREWSRPGRRFRCVVVAPWVLVQPLEVPTRPLH